MAEDTVVNEQKVAMRERLCGLVDMDPKVAHDDEVITAFEGLVTLAAKFKDKHGREVGENDAPALKDWLHEETTRIKDARAEVARERQIVGGRKSEDNIEEGSSAIANILEKAAKVGIWKALDLPAPNLDDIIRKETTDPQVKALQRANDDLLMVAAATQMTQTGRGAKDLQLYQKFAQALPAITKAMNTTTDAYWVPTQWSPQFIQTIYEATDVLRLFPRIDFPMGANTLRIPVEGTDVTVYGAGEPTLDDGQARFTASEQTPAAYVDVTCKAIAARTVVSWEMTEDAVVPVMDIVRNNIVRQFARGLDDAVINGDTAATHVHTGITTPNAVQRQFVGLFKKTQTDTSANVAVGTYGWYFETLMRPLLTMRQYADPRSTVLLVPNPISVQLGYLTGSQTTHPYVTASIPRLNVGGTASDGSFGGTGFGTYSASGGQGEPYFGRPAPMQFDVVPSAMVYANVNSSGVYDNSNKNYSDLIWVHLPSWLVAWKSELAIETFRDIQAGQNVMVGRARLGFQHLRGTDLTTALISGQLTVA